LLCAASIADGRARRPSVAPGIALSTLADTIMIGNDICLICAKAN